MNSSRKCSFDTNLAVYSIDSFIIMQEGKCTTSMDHDWTWFQNLKEMLKGCSEINLKSQIKYKYTLKDSWDPVILKSYTIV